MQLSITLKIALITAMLSSSAFAMPQPTFDSVFCTNTNNAGGFIERLAEYLNTEDKDNLRLTCKEIKQSIDRTIQNMVVQEELNEASLQRITNAADWLVSLKIENFPAAEVNPAVFPYLPALKKLDLTMLDLERTSISANNMQIIIQRYPQLQELNVSGCNQAPLGIAQALLENPDALQQLKKLDLNHTYISANNMHTIIQYCPQLQELNVEDSHQAAAGIAQALQTNPNALQNLKTLNLRYVNISAKQICTIIKNCPRLKELNVSYCEQAYTGIATARTVNKNVLHNLKSLIFGGTNIPAEQMYTIIQGYPQLEELGICGCRDALAGIIHALTVNPDALPNLKKLDLKETNPSIGQMHTIIQHCQQLEELNISYCMKAPRAIIQALTVNPNALQHLKKLDLQGANPSAEQIDFIRQSIPHVQIIWQTT